MDLNMLASNPIGAKERTIEDFEAIYGAAGFNGSANVFRLRDLPSVVEFTV